MLFNLCLHIKVVLPSWTTFTSLVSSLFLCTVEGEMLQDWRILRMRWCFIVCCNFCLSQHLLVRGHQSLLVKSLCLRVQVSWGRVHGTKRIVRLTGGLELWQQEFGHIVLECCRKEEAELEGKAFSLLVGSWPHHGHELPQDRTQIMRSQIQAAELSDQDNKGEMVLKKHVCGGLLCIYFYIYILS